MLEKDIEKIQSAETEAKNLIKHAHLSADEKKQELKKEIHNYKENKQSSYDSLKANLYKETDLLILKYKEEKAKELESAISKIRNLAHAHSDEAADFIIQSLTASN